MLCGLLDPTSGTATVGGFDVGREPEKVKRVHRLHVPEVLPLRGPDRVSRTSTSSAGSTGFAAKAIQAAAALGPRIGRARGTGAEPDPDALGRLEAAAGPRLRRPPRARDRLPRRAHGRGRPGLAPPLLGAHQRAFRAEGHRLRHDPLPGRGGILQRHPAHPCRPDRRRREPARAQGGGHPQSHPRGRDATGPSTPSRSSGRSPGSWRPPSSGPPSTSASRTKRRAAGSSATRLAAKGIAPDRIDRIVPSLEDVFIHKIEEQTPGRASAEAAP